ncbi:MAG: ImmA/IrrE family metallo-endopeptidase [Verrucomicrobia bacterium]|nr:ImmA/IrrE family metallo-endopeptidase [Verrucomicrobiota bacterium]
MDPERFKAPYITREQAWEAAERIRSQFWPSNQVPVEVEEILWKVGLRLEPLQSLKESGDVNALLRGDLQTIMVDSDEYMDDRKQNRIRFSIAHELGHFVLHRKIYQEMSYASIEAWIDFVQPLPEDQYSYIARQFSAEQLAGFPRFGGQW